jgi:processing peptidase subunit beta
MVIAAAGDIEHDELVKYCEGAFKDFPAAVPEGVTPTQADVAKFTGSEIRMREDHMKEAHIAIAFHGVGWSSPDHVPLLVIQSIVGSWDRSVAGGQNLTSRLARDIQTHELANSFMSFNTSYKDTGLFGIYLTTENYDFQDDLSYLVFKEWIRIAMRVTDADVVRAKNQLKTSLLLSLDGTTPVTEEIGRHILTYGRRIEADEMKKLIDAVDTKTVKAIAQKYLYDRDFAVVSKGRIESLPEYPRLR